MAKICNPPKDIEIPSISEAIQGGKFNREYYGQLYDGYLTKLRDKLKSLGWTEPEAGEVIRFPVADGYAEYMVARIKGGVILMHIPFGDAWHYQYIHRLTATDVRKEIAQRKAMAAIFSKKK